MRKSNVKKWHGSRGMTLVEMLLVMAILSVVMMAVISLFIPVQQSTVAQTQVSDVQGNLRLALKTMTRDLLIAGFLMPYDPIAFPNAAPDYYVDTPTSGGTQNSADFIIRTRAVGSDFARISSVSGPGGNYKLIVTDAEMVENFPAGSKELKSRKIQEHPLPGFTPLIRHLGTKFLLPPVRFC
jgi:prepilin-type N-terminal cleavage/methylation domain-containing protein